MSPKDQRNLFWALKLYFNSFNSIQSTKDCKLKHTCKSCHLKHNTLLHLPDAPKGAISGSVKTNQATSGIASGVIPTAMVPNDFSKITLCRALLHRTILFPKLIVRVVFFLQLKLTSGHSVITVNACLTQPSPSFS